MNQTKSIKTNQAKSVSASFWACVFVSRDCREWLEMWRASWPEAVIVK